MSTFYDTFIDNLLSHEINLLRFDANVRKSVMKIMKNLEKDIIKELGISNPTAPKSATFRKLRLEKLKKVLKSLIDPYYLSISSLVDSELVGLSKLEQSWLVSTINESATEELASAGLTKGQLTEIGKGSFLDGKVVAKWWKTQNEQTQTAVIAELQKGVLSGESLSQLIARIAGGKVGDISYKGVLPQSRKKAEVLIRTAVQQISANTRRATYENNKKFIYGIEQFSTLDKRTSDICIAYDGAKFSIPDYQPIPPNKKPYNGGVPRHWGCRSSEVPLIKNSKLPKSTRASQDGQLPEQFKYNDFLKKKSKAYQDDVLGKEKAKLWRSGKIGSLSELVDQSGRPLTLKEIEKKYNIK